ncbi:MAG TPA: serine hydrolase domain-containing protein, partial [Candidatus Tectomicrobia bacterium]|nr:serine hydrolase domain-containing protein [Candidatus Tectomicrobia bacterium]
MVVVPALLRTLALVVLAARLTAAATPAEAAGAADLTAVEEVVGDAIRSGEIPGAIVLVGRGDEILLHRAWGWRQTTPRPERMTTDTIFDIASLTKPLGTTLAVMALVERGAVKLDAPVGRYLPEFKGRPDITVQRLLTHSAGLPAIPPASVVRGGFPRVTRQIAKVALDYRPGTATQYSDTGFIVLGELVRRVSGERLDQYLARVFFRPLGMRDTMFNPPRSLRRRIAPTEFSDDGLLRGVVHDPRARLLKGVAGHAGMFSTAADLARLCRMLVNDGALEGRRFLKAATVQALWERRPDGWGTRALGWDIASPYARGMMPWFPAGAVGHTGFTGTSVWIDPASRTYLIILTNRVHPSGGGAAKIRELRTRVTAAVGAALFTGVSAPLAEGAAPD